MYVQFTGAGDGNALDRSGSTGEFAQSGWLDALVAFERIGSRRSIARNEEIFAEGDAADCWFKGGVRRRSALQADS